jgi:two-component system sensor histidine kinase FlrB
LHVHGDNQLAARLIDRLQFMERQIADMLLIAGGGEATVETISIPSVLSVLREQFEPLLKQRGIEFDIQHLSGRSAMVGNPDALIGALANVIENAAQACEDDDKLTHQITLRTRRRNGVIEIEISDNGKGMSDAVKMHALEPFFTTKRKGTGLGLAVVNAVVQSHQGQLQIHSEPGAGSRFVLSFPIHRISSSVTLAAGVAA